MPSAKPKENPENGSSYKRRTLTERKQSVPSGYRLVPADGKYAWVIAFSCFFCGLILVAGLAAFPVIMFDLMYIYDASTATVSWIPSIHVSFCKLLGPLNAVMINAFGCRKSAMLGSLVLSSGFIASYFVDHIGLLCLTYSVVTGFGAGQCLTTYYVVLSEYFKRYYGVSVGIMMASFAAARLVTPMFQFIHEEYGSRGVFLILGAISMQSCIGAALFQPGKWHAVLEPISNAADTDFNSETPKPLTRTEFPKIYQSRDIIRSTDEEENLWNIQAAKENTDTCLLNSSGIDIEDNHKRHSSMTSSFQSVTNHWSIYGSDVSIDYKATVEENDDDHHKDMEENKKGCAWNCLEAISSKIDLNLLKEPLFYLVSANGLLVQSLMVYSNLFVLPLGIEKGISPLQVSFVISAKAILEIGSRVATPSLVLLLGLSNRYTFMGLGFGHGILMLVAGRANTFSLLLSWAILCALTLGGCVTLSGVLTMNTMGAQRLSSVLGLSNLIQGIFLLPIAPTLGWLRDQYGSFDIIYTVLALQNFLLIGLWIVKPLIPIAKKNP